jgi:hypothetical protein
MSEWTTSVDRFQPGDQVWPLEGPMVFQRAPQSVIAVVSHPQHGEWLWLDGGSGRLGSWASQWWTTIKPSEEELADRELRLNHRLEENEMMWAEGNAPRRLDYKFG